MLQPHRLARLLVLAAIAALATSRATAQSQGTARPHAPMHAAQIVGGSFFTCARLVDGSVACWGGNHDGELGDGTLADRSFAVPVPGLTGVAELAAGPEQVCARLSNGHVTCWGTDYGRSPTPIAGVTDANQVVVSVSFGCARRVDGSVVCWGSNEVGQLGRGTETGQERSPPEPTAPVPGLTGVRQLVASGEGACAAMNDGAVRCWGHHLFNPQPNAHWLVPTVVPRFLVSGPLVYGQFAPLCEIRPSEARCLGSSWIDNPADPSNHHAPEDIVVRPWFENLQTLALGRHQCAVQAGVVSCWGPNDEGQLGTRVGADRWTLEPLSGLGTVTDVTVGSRHSCARSTDGLVHCWGGNNEGELGDGTHVRRVRPVVVLTN